MLELVRVCRNQRIYSSILTDNLSISINSGGKLNSYIMLIILYQCVSVNISKPIYQYGQISHWYRQILVWNSVLVCCLEAPIHVFSSTSIDILLISMNNDREPNSYSCYEVLVHVHLFLNLVNSLILIKGPWYFMILIFINGFIAIL